MKLAFAILLTALTIASSSASAENLPIRKAGLWEVLITASDSKSPTIIKQCIDEATDAKLQQNGAEMAEKLGGKCSKQEFKKTSTGYAGDVECDINGSKLVSKSTFEGDFTTSYTGQIKSSFNPPLMGKSENNVSMQGKWLGACTTGMVAGDMIMPNGSKMNINQISTQANRAGEILKDPKIAEMLKRAQAQGVQGVPALKGGGQ